jgi:PEGA domain
MRTKILCLSFLLASAVACSAAPALAGPATSFLIVEKAASDHADELLKRGLTLAKAEQPAQAEAVLREAWGLKRSWDIAGNLGIVETTLTHWRDAAEHLTYAFKTFPTSGKPEQKKLLEQTLAKALAEVSALTVKVSVDKAEVFVDGTSVGMAPLAEVVFVEPGARKVEAKLGGYETATAAVDAAKGGTSEVALEMKKVVVQVPPPPLPVKQGWRPGVPVLVTGGALAVVGLAVGAGLKVAANGKAADVTKLEIGQSSSCFAPSSSLAAQCMQLHDAASSKTMLSNAAASAFLVGGVLAVVTGGLGIWAAMPRAVTVQAAPTVGAGQVGMTLQGTW